jgi:hypothetical protein
MRHKRQLFQTSEIRASETSGRVPFISLLLGLVPFLLGRRRLSPGKFDDHAIPSPQASAECIAPFHGEAYFAESQP